MDTDGSSKLPALLLSVLMATISISASLPSWDFSILETKDTKQSVASNSSINLTIGNPTTIQTTLTGNSSSGTYDFDSNSTGMYFTSESIDSQGKVAVGERFICAIFADNKLKCWGNNGYGQLGVGYGNYETPQTVNFENGRYATYVASGPYHVCAILDDGSLRCWGQNRRATR